MEKSPLIHVNLGFWCIATSEKVSYAARWWFDSDAGGANILYASRISDFVSKFMIKKIL